MSKWGKKLAVLLSIVTMTGSIPFQAYGATKISSISLEIEDELVVGDDYDEDDIEVTAQSGHYYVTNVEIMNEEDEWKSDTIPRINIQLSADEGYYFSVKKDDIKIKGGTYVNGKREDSYTLIITVDLPSMLGRVGEISSARWDSDISVSWEPAYNAGYYELRLYRNGESVGVNSTRVDGTQYDVRGLMRKEGTYNFKVRAVNMKDSSVKSEWFEVQQTVYVDSDAARRNREQFGGMIPDGVTEPGQMAEIAASQVTYGWNHDDIGGWWYRNDDGGYTTNNWQLINGKWYYFNSVGYMVTGWIDWNGHSYYCDPVNGDMLVNTVVPDGSGRRVDSTGAWIQ